MNAAHVHLMISHIPVVGVGFGILFLLFLFQKNIALKKASLLFLVFVGLTAVPVYLSGEGAEETVVGLPDVTEVSIEAHEDAGKTALIAVEVLGGAALLSFFLLKKKGKLHPGIALLLLAGSLAVGGLMAYTANLGGRIRHSEIRSDFRPVFPEGGLSSTGMGVQEQKAKEAD